eukprot:scaffold115943_cov23-Tisochrysis_lutea.AAC.1
MGRASQRRRARRACRKPLARAPPGVDGLFPRNIVARHAPKYASSRARESCGGDSGPLDRGQGPAIVAFFSKGRGGGRD